MTKAYKLVNDERVKVLEKTLAYSIDHAAEKRNNEILEIYRKSQDEL